MLSFRYYTTGSACEQYEVNTMFWLAIGAGNIGPSCLIQFACFDPAQENKMLAEDLQSLWTICNRVTNMAEKK